MSPATQISQRHKTSLIQFFKFGLIGGSGVLVNFVALFLAKKLVWHGLGKGEHDAFANLFGSQFHVRWYHLLFTFAFVVANTWNFQLNRTLTFKSKGHARWIREFIPFFLVGAGVFGVGLLISTALMNPTSPVALPRSILDGSSGLRTPLYWANLIQIVLTMPLNFVLSKVWAFKAMRTKNVEKRAAAAREAEAATRDAEALAAATTFEGTPRAAVKPPCMD